MEIKNNLAIEQYQQLLKDVQGRKISLSDALKEYQEIEENTPDLHRLGNSTQDVTGSPIRFNLSTSVLDYFNNQSTSGKADYLHATNIYQHSVNAQESNDIQWQSFTKIIPLQAVSRISSQSITQLQTDISAEEVFDIPAEIISNEQHAFRMESATFLQKYAADHNEEWKQAAEELDINIAWGAYTSHFYEAPKNMTDGISVDSPKSKAEEIFRHIANPEEIEEFNTLMAEPQQKLEAKQQKLEERQQKLEERQHELTEQAYDFIENLLGGAIAASNSTTETIEFDKQLETFSKALEKIGLSGNDISSINVRQEDNGYIRVLSNQSQKAEIEDIINNSPEIHAIYTAAFNQV